MNQRVAVVGLGQMGGAMAERLADTEMELTGFDISGAVREDFRNKGMRIADSLQAALADCDVVLSSLPNSAAVREAWLGEQGIVALAKPGTLCVDLSTIDPDTMREIAAAGEARGLRVLDCPVSGGPKEARDGTLMLMVGGDEAVVNSAEDLLRRLGSSWAYSGPAGTAKVVKLVNNMMSMGNVLVAAEAFAVGVAAGVDPNKLYDILAVSGGRSHHFTKRFPNAIKGDFAPGFKMELGEKDLALAVELGRLFKVPTPAASMARELFAVALAEGYRGQDIVALLALYQKWAGTGSGAQLETGERDAGDKAPQ